MKLVILDRDGVINHDSEEFVKSLAEWRPIDGSLEAIARLCHAGYRVFIASNQSGLGRGLYDYDAFSAINDRLQKLVGELGGRIDGMEFAPDNPDHPDRVTDKRKPAPGMLKDLAKRLQVQLKDVPYVGDSPTDVDAALAAGARPVLVRTGKGRRTEMTRTDGVEVYDDLAAFVTALLTPS